MFLKNSYQQLSLRMDQIIDGVSNPAYWALDVLGCNLFDNQIEILNAVVDPDCRYLAVLQARGAGKTFAVAVGLVRLCLFQPGLQIGVFAPKTDQASRIIGEITTRIIPPGSSVYDAVNWSDSTGSRIRFANGSQIGAFSANEQTMSEGWHFSVLVIDEAHRVTDTVMNQRLIPTVGSLPNAKIIKIGIPMGKNHFHKSVNGSNTKYRVVCSDWTKCNILLSQGSVDYRDQELSRFVIDQMPLSMKQRSFPDRPDLLYDGAMTELDFDTQYAMRWVEDIALFLSDESQKRLVAGNHNILAKAPAQVQDHFFFGLDTAGGGLTPGRTDRDYTALAVWRLGPNGVKEKVACYEWQGDPLAQMAEIQSIIHPRTGLFPCTFGLADYSNIAVGFIETLKQQGFPVEGIMFGQSELTSGKNYKNAMFDQFIFELEQGRVHYPSIEKINQSACFKKAYNEWCNLERYRKLGINDTITAPDDLHDDHPCADVLAVWAMDKGLASTSRVTYRELPKGIVVTGGVASLSFNPGSRGTTNSPFFKGLSNPFKPSVNPYASPLH